MATFGELQAKVSTRLKDPNNSAVGVSDVAATINDAIKLWNIKRYWFNEFEESVVLTPNDPILPALSVTPEYLLTTGGITIDYANTRWELRHISSNEYDRINVEGKGIPFAWTYRNDTFELYYYPSADYTTIVRGVKSYADLVGDDDVNDFTEQAADLIMYETLARLYGEFRQDPKMENYYSARATNEHKALKRRTRRGNATGRMQVKGF